ncbi:MAG: PaaI family thioesterase [Candidatus Heimdallarchaeota archaeon]
MEKKAIQDYYPDDFAKCYGCGYLNEKGLKIKSYWDNKTESSVCSFDPAPYHTAIPGFVYGGLIASLIDCHGTGTAAAAGYKHEQRKLGTDPPIRYVTASLQVDYLKPTPIDTRLELRAEVKEVKGRRITVDVVLSANGEICAKGTVICVRITESMLPKSSGV